MLMMMNDSYDRVYVDDDDDSYAWVMMMMMIDDVSINVWNINLMIKNAMINIHAMFMMLCYATYYE